MCSIHGIGFQKGHTVRNENVVRKILTKLLINGMQRGRTATGVCYTTNKNITVIKDKVEAEEFVKADFYRDSLKKCMHLKDDDCSDQILSIIGHCRQKTKGTEQNNNNNHPIIYKNVIGVHNGIISNDDLQFEKFKPLFKRNAQVDSEIIFALVNHFSTTLESIPKGIQEACNHLSGGYACAMVHKFQPHILWLFRANSPCTIYHYKESGIIIFASLPSYITNAAYKYSLGDYTEIPINTYEGIGIDLYRNKYQRFDLNRSINAIGR